MSMGGPTGDVGAAHARSACAMTRVDLRGEGMRQSFAVEIAATPQERAKGLMLRESMANDAGMLFIYESPRRAEFWMKNTLIPLDMIFADARGRIVKIHENAIPHDLTPIYGGENIQYVLEINGGLARRLGIKAGGVLRHPLIASDPVWPCQ